MNVYSYGVYLYVILAAVVFVLPDVFHNLHWVFGVPKLNAPLVGCIATHAFCVFFKIFHFETCYTSKGARAVITTFMTFLFIS